MNDNEFIRRISRNAQDATPSSLPAGHGDDMIAKAIATAVGRAKRQRHQQLAAIAAVVLLGGMGLGWGASQRDPEPLHAQLPTGDQLTATPGADFRVASASAQLRHVEVRHGVVLFDVSPLEDDERFEVTTDDTVVRVRGTVFSVEREESRTSVRVYEGRVELEHAGRRQMVEAGWMWLGGDLVALGAGRLEQAGISAASTRAQSASSRQEDELQVAYADERDTQESDAQGLGVQQHPSVLEIGVESEEELGESMLGRARPGAEDVEQAIDPALEHSAPPASGVTPVQVTHNQVRRWIASRRYQRALVAARAHHWTLLEADALRGLRRFEDAADTYLRVSGEARAGYAAARIRFFELNDPTGALSALDTIGAGSSLDERVLGLRTRLLLRQGRQREAQQHAADYLQRFPEGGLVDWMSELESQP